jgi:hypothetical protein
MARPASTAKAPQVSESVQNSQLKLAWAHPTGEHGNREAEVGRPGDQAESAGALFPRDQVGD